MFDIVWMLVGFVAGMIVTCVFVPPMTRKKMVPDISNPDLVFRNPQTANACFRARSYQVPCTSSIDFLN